MELFNGSQFNMNCTNFTEADWRSLNLVRSVAAMLGTLIILATLSLLIYFKAYSSLFQRLYLYLIVMTLLSEVTGVISIEHQWYYHKQDAVCVASGFLLAWTYVSLFIFSYEIIVHLVYLVVSNIRGTPHLHLAPERATGCRVTVEVIYIAIPLTVSTAFSLPPLLGNKYGIAGPWCFVRSLNDACESSGYASQMAFYGMYMTLGCAGVVASLVLIVVYFQLASSFKEVRHLLKRTIYLLAFKFIHILLILCSIACRAYTLRTHRHQVYVLWLGHALSLPIGVLAFPLGYLLCFFSVGKTAQKLYKKVAIKFSKHSTPDNRVQAPPTITGVYQTTAPRSDRISQPSTTFFVALHSEIPSERSLLINDDKEYDSTQLP